MAIATFARTRPRRALVFERECPALSGPLLIVDVVGERQSSDLASRIRTVDLVVRPETVILRGMSQALVEQASADPLFLTEAFPSVTSLLRVEFLPMPALIAIIGNTPAEEQQRLLLDHLAQCELESHLAWNEGIWRSQDYHFVLPSGEHADLFVRLSDVFADPVALARLADWIAHTIAGPTLLLSDTPAMLPLLQELRIRSAEPTALRHLILPLYSLSQDEAEDRFAEVMPWCLATRAKVVAFISVTSSGGYKRQLDDLCSRVQPPNGVSIHTLCEASDVRTTAALAHIHTLRFPSRADCDLCKASSSTIEVDTQRFAAQLLVGSQVVELPKAKQLSELSFLLQQVDGEKPFRVHVDRPQFNRHLGIAIDPARLLNNRVFRAQATLSLAKVQSGFHPDLVLVPRHDSTDALCEWLKDESLPNARPLSLTEPISGELEQEIKKARAILICDAGMITSRTLRACVEIVQRTKGDADNDFTVKALVLVARPDVLATWTGISDRLFIKLDQNLEAAWVLSLPDHMSGTDCPWCTELRWLKSIGQKLPRDARDYVDMRIQRLSSTDGLRDRIYLGSELDLERDQRAGVHTTPNSYFGDLSDVGMFVGMSAVLQQMRNDWRKTKDYYTTRMALPLPKILRRFTDPIIPAAVLRAAKPSELRAPAILQDLKESLNEIGHARQHPVLLAELLYDIANHRLPITERDVSYLTQLKAEKDKSAIALAGLFEAVLHR